jgi:hypothetical protein
MKYTEIMKRSVLLLIALLVPEFLFFTAEGKEPELPLRIDPDNPYYFLDTKGKPLMLFGDYTWETFSGVNSDYNEFFKSLKSRGLNLARVWLWWGCEELPSGYSFPAERKLHIEPFLREGPGTANDGRPKYNLDKFNPVFFERLVDFCRSADKYGINLQLMMMDAWMIKHAYLWKLNAFNAANNINGVDGDSAKTGKGTDGKNGFCSMGNPKAMQYQKAYIKKVVEAVNSFKKIYFEIANENYYNEEWELALCDYIKEIEILMPNQHMTIRRDFPSHSYVIQKWDPLVVHKGIMDKRYLKVPLLFDTDWIINNNDEEVRKAMWSAVASGAHFSYMDDAVVFYRDSVFRDTRAALHRQIDLMAALMKKLKPWEMIPDDSVVKSGLAFAMTGNGTLFAYLPSGGTVTMNVPSDRAVISTKWFDPLTGRLKAGKEKINAGKVILNAPDNNDWVLIIKL